MDKSKLFKLAHMIVKFEELPTDKGILVSDNNIEIGAEVQLINADGEVVAAEDGEYATETEIIKVEGGKIVEINPAEEPEPEAEEPADEEELEDETPDEEPAVDEEKEQLKARVAELEAAVAEKDAKIEELTAEIEQLKNKPVDEPVEHQMNAQAPKAKRGALKYFE